MSTDDRFLPQGKQILAKICQVRPMPLARETGNDTACAVFLVTPRSTLFFTVLRKEQEESQPENTAAIHRSLTVESYDPRDQRREVVVFAGYKESLRCALFILFHCIVLYCILSISFDYISCNYILRSEQTDLRLSLLLSLYFFRNGDLGYTWEVCPKEERVQ